VKRLVLVAVGLLVAYALLEALGLVDELGVLTSTPPPGQRFEVALAGAGLSLASWFGAAVLAPICLLTAALMRVTLVVEERLRGGEPGRPPARSPR
jgi:hypothetical protein